MKKIILLVALFCVGTCKAASLSQGMVALDSADQGIEIDAMSVTPVQRIKLPKGETMVRYIQPHGVCSSDYCTWPVQIFTDKSTRPYLIKMGVSGGATGLRRSESDLSNLIVM